MNALTCPVCHNAMRGVDREGITIDVCNRCKGVWLDRGELDKLLHYAGRGDDDHRPDISHYARESSYAPRQDDRAYGRYHKPYRKKSKLETLFDLFD